MAIAMLRWGAVGAGSGDMRDAPQDKAAALVVGEIGERTWIEDPAIAVLDEVATQLEAQRAPVDVVGIGEDAILQKALATTQRQAGGVDREFGLRPEGPEERDAAESALAAADNRDLGTRRRGDARELVAPAVAVEDP